MSSTTPQLGAVGYTGARVPIIGVGNIPLAPVCALGDGLGGAVAALVVGLDTVGVVVMAIAIALALTGSGRDHNRLDLRITDDLAAVVARCGAASLVMMHLPWTAMPLQMSLYFAIGSVTCVLAVRMMLYGTIVRARIKGRGLEDTLIVGAGPVAAHVADALRCQPELGLRPIGFVDRVRDVDDVLPVLGAPENLRTLIEQRRVRRVVIAFGAMREAEIISTVRACRSLPVRFFVLPRFFDMGPQASGWAWGFPLTHLCVPANVSWRVSAKRAFDLAVAVPMLALCLPVMAFCALGVRLSSPGPVLFRQRRVGLNGEPFDVLKFRSMRVNDDGATTWNVDHDDRVTRFGGFLRVTHLDELPQLWNVVRGDMSIVGPRPERPFFADQYTAAIPGYADRHRVKTGITGWAQVNGLCGDTSIEARARYDNQYIECWTPWRDVAIMFRTLPTLLGRRGSRVATHAAPFSDRPSEGKGLRCATERP